MHRHFLGINYLILSPAGRVPGGTAKIIEIHIKPGVYHHFGEMASPPPGPSGSQIGLIGSHMESTWAVSDTLK